MKIFFFIFLIFFYTGILFAQSDTSVFIVPELNIYQMEKGKELIYEFNRYKNFLHLIGDTIRVSPKRYKYSIDISAVNKISLRNGSKIWKAMGYSALIAFSVGFVLGCIMKPPDFGGGTSNQRTPVFGLFLGTLFAIPVGIIGGLAGALTPDYTDIELKAQTNETKKFILLKALKKHNFE